MARTASFLGTCYVPAHLVAGYSVLLHGSAIQVSLVTEIPVSFPVMTVLVCNN